jgi:hypothetical protein
MITPIASFLFSLAGRRPKALCFGRLTSKQMCRMREKSQPSNKYGVKKTPPVISPLFTLPFVKGDTEGFISLPKILLD